MTVISKSNSCPYCGDGHQNLCFVEYANGHWCYSCNRGTIRDGLAYAYMPEILPICNDKDMWLPSYSTNIKNFPMRVLEWLYGYYVYDDLIKKYMISYCEPQAGKDESVLLPISTFNGIVAYQRRFFPKAFYSSSDLKKYLFIAGHLKLNALQLVLVEDYLSAIRVGEVVPCLCLFGTKLNDMQLNFILQNFNEIIIWLDGDQPGINASRSIASYLKYKFQHEMRLMAYRNNKEIKIREIHTKQDPKELSKQQIINTLGD